MKRMLSYFVNTAFDSATRVITHNIGY